MTVRGFCAVFFYTMRVRVSGISRGLALGGKGAPIHSVVRNFARSLHRGGVLDFPIVNRQTAQDVSSPFGYITSPPESMALTSSNGEKKAKTFTPDVEGMLLVNVCFSTVIFEES